MSGDLENERRIRMADKGAAGPGYRLDMREVSKHLGQSPQQPPSAAEGEQPVAWLVEGDSAHLDRLAAEYRARFAEGYMSRAPSVVPLYTHPTAPAGVEALDEFERAIVEREAAADNYGAAKALTFRDCTSADIARAEEAEAAYGAACAHVATLRTALRADMGKGL